MAYNKETGMYEGWIYMISCDRTEYVYIGQTKQYPPEYRFTQHINAAKNHDYLDEQYDRRLDIHRDIAKYGEQFFHFNIIYDVTKIKKNQLNNALNVLEMHFIKKFDSFHNGYNRTSGGAGAGGNGKSCDAYNKNGTFLFSTDTVSEMAQRTGISSMSIIKSCDGINVPRDNYVFRWHGDSFDLYRTTVNHRHNKIIYCYNLTGEFYKEYNSISDASKDLGIYYNSITQALQRNSMTHGFYFNTKKSFDYIPAKGHKIEVDLYDYNTKEFFGSFESIRSALNAIGGKDLKASSVKNCLEGKHNQLFGYIWRYKGHPVDEFKKVNSRISMMKPLNVYDSSDKYIGTFPSASYVGKQFDIDKNRAGMYARKVSFSGCKDLKIYFANDTDQPDKTRVTNMTAKEIIEKYGYVV